jgi:hypothetical protein
MAYRFEEGDGGEGIPIGLLRVHEKIKSHFIHLGFRPSSPDPGVAKSSKELAIPTVLPPPDRTNLTQIQAPII